MMRQEGLPAEAGSFSLNECRQIGPVAKSSSFPEWLMAESLPITYFLCDLGRDTDYSGCYACSIR